MLLEKGASIDITNNKGETALHNACRLCRFDRVQALLEHGAQYNIKNNDGLMASEIPGPHEVIQCLLKRYLKEMHNEGISLPTSYLFFANFLMFSTAIVGQIDWNHVFFRGMIKDCLTQHFKSLDGNFEVGLLDTWYTELYG
jgi:hypothetical protein